MRKEEGRGPQHCGAAAVGGGGMGDGERGWKIACHEAGLIPVSADCSYLASAACPNQFILTSPQFIAPLFFPDYSDDYEANINPASFKKINMTVCYRADQVGVIMQN